MDCLFEIHYRIVDDVETLRVLSAEQYDSEGLDIEGYFSLNFNGNVVGFYHDNDLREGETGQELLTLWFDLLMDVVVQLKTTKYAALKMIETYDTWLEFTLLDDEMLISLAKFKAGFTNEYLIIERKNCFDYPKWKDVKVSFSEFVDKIEDNVKKYFHEVENINPSLMKSKTMLRVVEKIKLL